MVHVVDEQELLARLGVAQFNAVGIAWHRVGHHPSGTSCAKLVVRQPDKWLEVLKIESSNSERHGVLLKR